MGQIHGEMNMLDFDASRIICCQFLTNVTSQRFMERYGEANGLGFTKAG